MKSSQAWNALPAGRQVKPPRDIVGNGGNTKENFAKLALQIIFEFAEVLALVDYVTNFFKEQINNLSFPSVIPRPTLAYSL